MKDYHEQWMADRRAISANIDAAVADILREGYASISEPMPGPCRQHVKRANRDRPIFSPDPWYRSSSEDR